MKRRYWIFAFSGYYPSGGLNDLKIAFDNIEEYQVLLNERNKTSIYEDFIEEYDYFQILDTETKSHLKVHRSNYHMIAEWITTHVES